MSSNEDHTKRPLTELQIDLSLFTSGTVEELVSSVSDVSVGVASYREVFTREARLAENNAQHNHADTLQVLYILIDMTLKPDDVSQPFHPSSWIGNARSPIPNDFTDEQISQVEKSLSHVNDPRLLARLADVAWVKLKSIDAANRAITAYLEASCDSKSMELERYWFLERALRLAKQINSAEQMQKCEAIFHSFMNDQTLFSRLDIELLSLSKSMGVLDNGVIAEAAYAHGVKKLEEDPHGAEQLLQLAASLYFKAGDKAKASDCHRKVADRYLEIAKETDALTSISFIENGIEALKKAGASKVELQEVNKFLTQRGKESIAQMKRIEGPKVDFSNQVRAAREFVSGLTPMEALRRVALQFPVLSYSAHKTSVEESIRKSPLMHFIGAKHISDKGRQYSRRPSFLSDNQEEQQLAMDTEVWASMALDHQMLTKFSLIPALSSVHWTTKDMVQLANEVSSRPIIPPDRSELFYSGIKLGLEGRFCEAAHILIPQLENSLRFLLEAMGHNVSQLGNDLLHNEMLLNPLFKNYRKVLVDLFESDDLVFVMESFLCLKSGENFRNEMAHGLISNANDFRFAFAWWLVVYLIFILKFPDAQE
jgi:hypothetical protein